MQRSCTVTTRLLASARLLAVFATLAIAFAHGGAIASHAAHGSSAAQVASSASAVNPTLLLDACVGGDPLRIDFAKIDAKQLDAALAANEQLLRNKRELVSNGPADERPEVFRAIGRCERRSELLRAFISSQGQLAMAIETEREQEALLATHRSNGADKLAKGAEAARNAARAEIEAFQRGIDLDVLRICFGGVRGVSPRQNRWIVANGETLAFDVARSPTAPVHRSGKPKRFDAWAEVGEIIRKRHEAIAALADPRWQRTVEYEAHIASINAFKTAWDKGDRAALQRLSDEWVRAILDLTEVADVPKADLL